MINAKEELLEALQRSGKSIEDIEFAGIRHNCNINGEAKDIDSISYGLDMSGRICTIILVPDKD